MLSFIVCLLLYASTAYGYLYVAVEERRYRVGEPVNVTVNSLRSDMDLTPYEYYSMPFCRPHSLPEVPDMSLGSYLMGDAMLPSVYHLPMMKQVECARIDTEKVCAKGTGTASALAKNVNRLRMLIEDDYRAHISIDNLPGWNRNAEVFNATCNVPFSRQGWGRRGYFVGVPSICQGQSLLNNHLRFRVKVRNVTRDTFSVVGFNVVPMSIHWQDDDVCASNKLSRRILSDPKPVVIDELGDHNYPLHWTYSVEWVLRDTAWNQRWDAFLDNSSEGNVNYASHVFWIFLLTVMSSVLAVLGYVTLIRVLHRDIARYNEQNEPQANAVTIDHQQEDVGWKLVHGDVFRPPERCGLLAVFVGSGVQLLGMCVLVLFFALSGGLAPNNRGSLLSSIIVLFVFAGLAAGYVVGLLLKTFQVQEWKFVFLCALLFPGSVFSAWFLSNLMYWSVGSSAAVPFSAFITIVALWLLVTTFLSVIGAKFAFNGDAISFPVKVGKLAREVPEVHLWYLKPYVTLILPGLCPFLVAYMELSYVLKSIWLGQIYYAYPFLAITFFVWLATVVLVSLITQFYQLTYEDYRWWWRSFAIPSSCGIPIVALATYLYLFELTLKTYIAFFVYWSYMFLFTAAYILASGAAGLLAGLFMARKIYGAIKID